MSSVENRIHNVNFGADETDTGIKQLQNRKGIRWIDRVRHG